MKKLLVLLPVLVTFFIMTAASASALTNDMVKVGLRSGDSALFSANLENARGEGYAFGWFDDDLEFQEIGFTDETAISMTAAGDIYVDGSGTYSEDDGDACIGRWHVELWGFDDFDEAQEEAWEYDDAYPAYIDGEFVVRIGSFEYEEDAEDLMYDLGLEDDASVEKSSKTGVVVTRTRSTEVLFEFDCSGVLALGVMPWEEDEEPSTWFKGYKYGGGFSYPRITGGNLMVLNIVHLEEYVKGVIPYEMDDDWPIEALEAQAVCARTYVSRGSRHSGFDVCGTTCCQLYNGHGSGGAGPSRTTDRAVENTEGECMYYEGDLVRTAVYHSSNGGATEDGYYVWGTDTPYLKGKEDPYEELIDIPNYEWEVTYTDEDLTWILQQKGYDVGDIEDVYIEEYTPNGNVYKVTFVHEDGELTVKGDTCRTIFYSSTLGKSVRSLRFDINGSSAGKTGKNPTYYVNNKKNSLSGLFGISVLSGSGEVEVLEAEEVTVITADGKERLDAGSDGSSKPKKGSQKRDGEFVITGSGNGHNVGLSQYGARAMAEDGYDYDEILEFYFTDIDIE